VITSFDARYRIDQGELLVTETIAVDFGATPNHGIIREVPTLVEYDLANDEIVFVTPESVQRDGVDEPFEANETFDTMEIKAGDPAVEITGAHTYVIQYRVSGGIYDLLNTEAPAYEIRWNATGSTWSVPIESATVTVELADGQAATDASCLAGIAICTTQVEAAVVTFQATNIPPGDGLSFTVEATGESGALEPLLAPRFDEEPVETEFEVEEEPFEFPFETEEIFEELRGTYDRVGFSVSSMDAGFAFDLTVLHADGFDPGFRFEPTQAFDSHFAERVPAETMLFLAGYDIYNQSWLPAKQHLEELDFGEDQTFQDILDDISEETGVDIEAELLAQLTGEYAVAADVSEFEDNPDFSILALLDLEDPEAAQAAIEELVDYAEDQEGAGLEEQGIRWTIDDGDFVGGYPESVVDEAAAGFDNSLADNGDWQRTLELLPPDKTFIGFVSIARILEEVGALPDAEADVLASTNGEIGLDDLEPIRSVGFSGTARDNGFGFHAVLFMED
jgi:hypothetical protein